MDAVTLVAAAVAIAIDDSRNAALEDCLLDRERQAMRAADLESLIAQHTFRTDMPHLRVGRLLLSSPQMPYWGAGSRRNSWLEAEREASRAAWAAWSDSDNSDAEPVVQIALQPALDLQPVQRPPQPVQRCVGCGSTRNLELLLPTGRWANAPMEQRLFCNACIEAAAAP